jgi:hypothetical protein
MWPFRHRPLLDELAQDIRDHLDREIQRNIDRGMSPEAARDAARRAFGSAMRSKEDARAVWIPLWMDQLGQDVRYASRTLRKNRGYTAAVVTILALAIRVNGAVFTVANGILFRGTPHIDAANRLVYIQSNQGVSYPRL